MKKVTELLSSILDNRVLLENTRCGTNLTVQTSLSKYVTVGSSNIEWHVEGPSKDVGLILGGAMVLGSSTVGQSGGSRFQDSLTGYCREVSEGSY